MPWCTQRVKADYGTHWNIKPGQHSIFGFRQIKSICRIYFLRVLSFLPLVYIIVWSINARECLLPICKWSITSQQTWNILSYLKKHETCTEWSHATWKRESQVKFTVQRGKIPKALGKANLIHLSYTITVNCNPKHLFFFLFRHKRANCPGSELNICFTKQRY